MDGPRDRQLHRWHQESRPKLIQAAAQAGRGRGPSPAALNDALTCESLGLPLAAGGLLDQPYARTQAMLAAKAVYAAFRLYTQSPLSDVEFSQRHPDAWELVTQKEFASD